MRHRTQHPGPIARIFAESKRRQEDKTMDRQKLAEAIAEAYINEPVSERRWLAAADAAIALIEPRVEAWKVTAPHGDTDVGKVG